MNFSLTDRLQGQRVEDHYLLRGTGRFAADSRVADQAVAYFVRSPYAAADILSVSVDDAKFAPGVLAVLTGEDMRRAGVLNIGEHPPMVGRGGKSLAMPARPALVDKRVQYAGEAIALVVAETLAQAQDAAELVSVDYKEREALIDLREAVEPGASQIWPEAPGNVALDWLGLAPDPDANARTVEEIIRSAPQVARLSLVQQRIVGNSLETRGATASYDKEAGTYLLRCCSQGARTLRDAMAGVMGLPNDKLRVITEDVGGAFGFKVGTYPEYAAIMVAARTIGRPVFWMATRSEAFLSDTHARDAVSDVELAIDQQGRFLALRIRHLANMGAYIGTVSAKVQTENVTRCLPGVYDIKHIDIQSRCVFTNTVPTAPYRGAGRPEANYIIERLVEEAARLTGIDRIELRRRNLIPSSSMPYKTAVSTTYDTGEFSAVLDKALDLSKYNDFQGRRAEAKSRGKLRGIGVSCALEHSGATPVEGAWLTFPGGDEIRLNLNVQSTGQSHGTTFPRVIAEKLGIKPEQVVHYHGDSAFEIAGYGSVGSRSAMGVSHAMVKAVDIVLNKGTKIAAAALEASEHDIGYEAGSFEVIGTDRRMPLFDVAAHAVELKKLGLIEETLDTKVSVETPLTFPNGCHIAEVEIDPVTGEMSVVNYSAVDDCGNVLDRVIVEGQAHGAIVQGLGQALLEHAVFDRKGQLTTGSYMDYAMPRAHHVPLIKDALHIVPATSNPLGVKGAGEAGTTAAIAAIMNAIADAIPGEAGSRIDMPATSEKIWQACCQMAAA